MPTTKPLTTKAPKHKAPKSQMDLITLFEKFGNDEKCRMYLEKTTLAERHPLRPVRLGKNLSHLQAQSVCV